MRLSWTTPSGTARNQAIGGAMGSLGGEITSTFVNPAGLGFYKNSEFVITPAYNFSRTKGAFRGSDPMSLTNVNNIYLGTSGFVFGWSDKYTKWKSKAVSLAINRVANFKQDIYYFGTNDFSSFSEQFAEEFSNSGLPINADLTNASLTAGTKLAVYTYLIDTATINGSKQVVGLPQRNAFMQNQNALLTQENHVVTSGGITEIALGFAANMDDKLYLGGSLGVPIVNYERNSIYGESDASGNTNNNFNYSRFRQTYTSKGIGLNAKLGVIFKPVEYVRLGLAIHSPSIYGLKDTYTASMATNLENYFGTSSGYDSIGLKTITGNDEELFKYDLVTPFKFIISGSYVFREVEDITRQRGFITADIEYVNHRGSNFSASEQNTDDTYYKGVNDDIDAVYRGAFNFRVGGELKFKTIMTRLGFAYFGSPYKEKELKARRMNLSGGLGYRNKGIFIDLTYVHQLNKDVHFPYRLGDKANTFANLKEANGNIVLTVGFKI